MKTRMAIFAMAVSAFIIAGCTGVPAPVNHYGNTQPGIQVFQPLDFNSTIPESEVRTFGLSNNPDGSVTMFRFNGFQIKLMPMIDNR